LINKTGSGWKAGGRVRAGMLLAAALLTGMAGVGGASAQPAEASGVAEAAPSKAAPIPAATFFQHPSVLKAQLSPSGKRVAISTSRGSPRVGLAVLELEPQPKARRVALFADADITSFQWVGEDWLVFRVHDLQEGSGEDYRLAPGLYAAKADGSLLHHLVRRRGQPLLREGGGLARREPLEWNHVLLSVPERGTRSDSPEIVIGEMVFKHGEIEHIRPLWLNIATGRTRHLPLGESPPYAVEQWLFDTQAQPRFALSQVEDRYHYHWRDEAGRWRELAQGSLLKQPFQARAVDDAGNLYVSRPLGARGDRALFRYDFEAGKTAPEPLVSTPGFDFSGALLTEPSRSGQALGVRVETDAETTVWFHPALKALQAEADARMPGRVNTLSCRRCGEADMVVLVHSHSDRDPGQYWLYQAESQRWQPVSRVMEGIDPRRSAAVDFQRIKARDGRDLPVWLTLPQGVAPGRPAPAVVMVHGGPWVRGGHWRWQAEEQFLASRGYLVISPEFRGSTGYGAAHFRAGWKQWGRAMQDDVADALLWARQQGLADPERACIAGASYGGYATLMGLIRHPELYRCGIAWVAVTDPFLYLEGSWRVRDDVSDTGRRYVLPEMVGDAQQDAALLREVSPVLQAGKIQAPLMLAFGREDLRVPLAHGERLREALQAAGREPEWVVYAGEGHGWRKPENRVDFAQRLERFLARHLGTP
jgi:acetyl esterase/lipase